MRITSVALAVLLISGLAACSSSDDDATPNPSPAPSQSPSSSTAATGKGTGTVHDLRALAGNRWSTGTLALKVGDSVKVTDADTDVPHNFHVAGVGQSGTMNGGDTFTLRFDKAGTFDFVCTFHQSQGMEGTITVS
jgi:plastocyanin